MTAEVQAVVSVIENSPIVVPERAVGAAPRAPAATGHAGAFCDVALDGPTPLAAWAKRQGGDVDAAVLRWIASHVKGRRLRGPLTAIATLLIGASGVPVTAPLAGLIDLLI